MSAAETAAAMPRLFEFTTEHEALREVMRRFLGAHAGAGDRRASWERLVAGLGLDEVVFGPSDGETAFTAIELAIVAEEAGAELFGGPLVSAAAVGPLTARWPGADLRGGKALPALGVSMAGADPALRSSRDGTRVSGRVEPVWDLPGARVIVCDVAVGGEVGVVALNAYAPGVAVTELGGLDLSRGLGRVECADAPVLFALSGTAAATVLAAARRRAELVLSAELLGLAQRVLDRTVEYAKGRVQFGRTIGSFQAVKHRLADLLASVELTRSAVYNAAWSLATDPVSVHTDVDLAAAASVATESALTATKSAVQLHGGIAITWEHWAHRYLRRAHAVSALTGGPAHQRGRLADLIDLRDGRYD
ncbi:hypothetical protein NDR87_00255 [Nocardia sp. CDC159]|uniref:Acyl-CoA dehydrogenase/oxidase C-terminal domain-containing protein n=1 Tax=Nocardia pulmonis TaxID=2951408 RepID=A0A9X2E6T0_9NOCA|nr:MULTISPECIES: acyl-CoA dehydrogenase [Nocardia]MCM6772558.1 hypothetical protein [Nocardia pulmonis]MCM6784784.1 hypothetical protein [Nocardia sp. CDC159]